MPFQELSHLRGLVGREVVGDHVDLFAARLIHNDIGEEGNELRRSMTRRGLAEHFARFGVERRVQRQRAVSVVLKTMPLRAPRESGNTGSLRSSAWIVVFSS